MKDNTDRMLSQQREYTTMKSNGKNIAKITFYTPSEIDTEKQNLLQDLMKEMNYQQPDIIRGIVNNVREDKDIVKIAVGGTENSTEEKMRAMKLFTEILKRPAAFSFTGLR